MSKVRLGILGGTILLLATAGFIYKREFTFDVAKLHSNLAYNTAWEIPPASQDTLELVDKILSDDLTYLGRGAQCYAFATKDGRYVVKLFKHHHLRQTTVLDDLPIPRGWFSEYRYQKAQKRKAKQEHLFTSCKIAYLELPEETGLIYIALNKGLWAGKIVRIQDRFGKWHTIDFGSHEFMIQKRAIMAVDAIDTLMAYQDIQGCEEYITKILTSLSQRCNKGVVDLDPAFNQNFGITATGAMQIDVGRFERNPLVATPPVYGQEIRKISNQFREWLEQNHPILLHHFDEQLSKILEAKEREVATGQNHENIYYWGQWNHRARDCSPNHLVANPARS